MAWPVEPARSDPAHIGEADILLDAPSAFDCISGDRPAAFRADLGHLAPRVHECDPAYDPGRLTDPGGDGRPDPGPDRARHPRRRHLSSRDAFTQLADAVVFEQNDEWTVSRKYMTLVSIGPVSDNLTI